MTPELLSEEVLEKQGALERVRRYYQGWHPELEYSELVQGWTGRETRQEVTVVKPIRIFEVKEQGGEKNA